MKSVLFVFRGEEETLKAVAERINNVDHSGMDYWLSKINWYSPLSGHSLEVEALTERMFDELVSVIKDYGGEGTVYLPKRRSDG